MNHFMLPDRSIACGEHDFDSVIADSVEAALQSDCFDCRVLSGFVPHVKTMDSEAGGISPVPEWTPQPMPNADEILAEVVRKRDGL